MKQNIYENYFVLVKLMGLLALSGSLVVFSEENIYEKTIHFFILALFLFAAVMTELAEKQSQKFLLIAGEGILSVTGVFLFPVTGAVFLSVCALDWISFLLKQFFPGKVWYFAIIYALLLVFHQVGINMAEAFCFLTFLILFYIQEKVVLEKYRVIIDENERAEGRLKTTIERSDKHYRDELNRSRLQYENAMLEDRSRISQALHDKLGHSINGSLYKLEAAKLLMEKKPDEAKMTIQEVIDSLRESMDEIRMILRRERPDKKRMALLSLQSFLEECEEKYGIHMELKMSGTDSGKIPEKIWEIILDNTFEAVTNALKYAACKNISINIIPMNEVVRCSIRDDGIGAPENMEEGMGISGMKKRVRDVKGFFDVETAPGMGFAINMILPII